MIKLLSTRPFYGILEVTFFLLNSFNLRRINIVSAFYSRTPRQYDGTELTTHRMNDLLPQVLAKIGEVYQQRSDLILAMWPDMIGAKLAEMTQAVSFIDGVLFVKVKNSTLHNLLSQYEKTRLLRLLRQRFRHVEIKNICFRIG